MMKKFLLAAGLLLCLGVFSAFSLQNDQKMIEQAATETEEKINWISWEEAIKESETAPKKIFIDMYTDWCGWCKRMDATTFSDPKVAAYINKNFYAVKFDAERKDEVEYKGHTFKFVDQGRRGVHELAYALLDGRLGYPSYVYLDEEQRRITVSPGYKQVDAMITELEYVAGEHYTSMTFEDFQK